LLKDGDKAVRAQAVRALAGVGGRSDEVINALTGRVSDDSAEVRIAAIDELAQMGPAAKPAIPALTAATRDGRAAVREAAVNALKRIQALPTGPNAPVKPVEFRPK
jgi:HEAT repeat protein